MSFLQAVVLGLIQGLTEFLPVSSSAHLRIVPEVLGWDDPGASFTAIVQLGTTAAVLLVFWGDLVELARGAWAGLRDGGRRSEPAWRTTTYLAMGTIPIAALGLLLRDAVDGPLRSLPVVAGTLVAGSAWIWFATAGPAGTRQMSDLGSRQAALIGTAQAAALIPGVSRSGATIGAGLLLGMAPSSAARFSFLLSIPAIVLSGLFGLRDIGSDVDLAPTLVATAIAFATGYASIRWFLRIVAAGHLRWFIPYRLGLAVLVVAMIMWG
jgi:undecaprenyl-diphosphatase